MSKFETTRRGLMKGSAMTAALAGTAAFFGPWQHTRLYAQGQKKPIKLGLTCDASGHPHSGRMTARHCLAYASQRKGACSAERLKGHHRNKRRHRRARVADRSSRARNAASGLARCFRRANASPRSLPSTAPSTSIPSLRAAEGVKCSRVKFVLDGNGTIRHGGGEKRG